MLQNKLVIRCTQPAAVQLDLVARGTFEAEDVSASKCELSLLLVMKLNNFGHVICGRCVM